MSSLIRVGNISVTHDQGAVMPNEWVRVNIPENHNGSLVLDWRDAEMLGRALLSHAKAARDDEREFYRRVQK